MIIYGDNINFKKFDKAIVNFLVYFHIWTTPINF